MLGLNGAHGTELSTLTVSYFAARGACRLAFLIGGWATGRSAISSVGATILFIVRHGRARRQPDGVLLPAGGPCG